MKTSLIIDERVFSEAKKESQKTGRSISEIISLWASIGRKEWKSRQDSTTRKFTPVNLGTEKMDLKNRKEWMDKLDDRS